ncbi:MAG: NAD(P)/FAD-dependent oxidoreductase, partial [Planctomycetota bacterium]
MSENYDCIIVGGGPAGLAAALYASRDRFKTVILEKFMPGGQINLTERIENYPGIQRIDGPGLVAQMQKQAESFGTEIKNGAEVTSLEKLSDGQIAVICDDDEYVARGVILAPGSD